MTDLHDIAAELARTKPSDVDQDSGYVVHEDSNTIGWYTAHGNTGHPVLTIADTALKSVYATLAALDDAEFDRNNHLSLQSLLSGMDGVELHV